MHIEEAMHPGMIKDLQESRQRRREEDRAKEKEKVTPLLALLEKYKDIIKREVDVYSPLPEGEENTTLVFRNEVPLLTSPNIPTDRLRQFNRQEIRMRENGSFFERNPEDARIEIKGGSEKLNLDEVLNRASLHNMIDFFRDRMMITPQSSLNEEEIDARRKFLGELRALGRQL